MSYQEENTEEEEKTCLSFCPDVRKLFKWPDTEINAKNDYDGWVIEARIPFGHVREAHDMLLEKSPIYNQGVRIRIVQIPPPLIPANVGDIVSVYSDTAWSEEDFSVGIVSSVNEVNGKRLHGCRHYVVRCLYDMNCSLYHLTEEDYGGYPEGFYRKLSKDEAISRLYIKAKNEAAKASDGIAEKLRNISTDISSSVDKLKNTPRMNSLIILPKKMNYAAMKEED